MKKTITLCLLWLGIVGIYIYYGYFVTPDSDEYRNEATNLGLGPQFLLETRTEYAVLWGGYGIGLATCVTVGLAIVGLARSGRLHAAWAVLLFLISAAGSTVLTSISMDIAQDLIPFKIFEGESGLLPLFQIGGMFLTAAFSFVVFSIWIFLPKRKKEIAV